jgi:hypothetical protein
MLMFEFLGGSKTLTLNLVSNLYATRSGGSVTFTVTAYADSSLYSGAAVTFYKINSDNSITSIGSGTTNVSGVATLVYTISGVDTPQKFYVYFAGNTTWGGNSSNIVSINVEPSVNFSYFNTVSGSGTWTVPTDVYSISVLAIGAGGSSKPSGISETEKGGGGGAIAWYNTYSVTPGQVFGYNVSTPSDIKGGYTSLFDNTTSNIIVKAEAGWQDTTSSFGDAGSANWVGQYGGRGGQGGTGYIYSAGNPLVNYYPHGGGGGAPGGRGNNPYYTGTGTNVGFNGPATAVGPGGSNPLYTISGYPTNQQPNGGSASYWSSTTPTNTASGGNSGGWTVSTVGVMTIATNPSSATPTIYGWGAGGNGVSWRSDFSPPAAIAGGNGFLQIMWGNNPTSHTFPAG